MIKLPIEIGDTILTGKFRNHRQEVETIETDDWGHPTVNGKSILKIRIAKLMNKVEAAFGPKTLSVLDSDGKVKGSAIGYKQAMALLDGKSVKQEFRNVDGVKKLCWVPADKTESRLERVIEQASALTEAEVDADLTTSSGSPAIQMSADTARDNDLFPKAAGKEITIKGGKRVKLLKAISMNGALWAVKVLSESVDSRIKIGVSVKKKDGSQWRVTGIEDNGEVLLRGWDGQKSYADINDLTFVSTFAK